MRKRNQTAPKGAVLPFMIIMMTFVVAMAAFGVDIGYISMIRAQLRTAIDAATRAGASGLRISPAEARKRAKEIAAENKVNGHALILQDSDIQFGNWNATTKTFTALTGASESSANALQITGLLNKARNNSVNLIFAPVFGQSYRNMTASAIAGLGQGADIAIVQDITSSFQDELADAKTGDQAFLDALYAGGTGSSRVAIIAHTGWGKTMASLQSVGSNYSYLSGVITNLKHCGNPGMPVCSGTDIAAGFDEAINTFTASGYVASSGGKVVVLVSDGQPTQNSNGSHPTLSDSQLLALARTRADQLWGMKVHVYVVFFNRENDPTAEANVKSLARGTGDFVQVTDAKQLPVALAAIIKKLPVQLVR